MSIKGEAFGQQLVVLVRDYFARATKPLLERLAGVERNLTHLLEQFKALKVPTTEDIDKAVADAAAKYKPADGKDADPDVIMGMVKDEVKNWTQGIPVPKDGKDVDPSVIQAMVKEAVANEGLKPHIDTSISVAFEKLKTAWIKDLQDLYASIPKPQDGKDADPELVRSLVEEAVSKIPKPENGKDADEGAIREMVQRSVEAAISALPPPKPGRDADPEDIRKAVESAVEALPKPKDGAPADPEETLHIVNEAVGKGLTNLFTQTKDFVDGLVDDRIVKTVEALPKFDPKELERLVDEETDSLYKFLNERLLDEIKKLPPAEPGRPGKDVDLEQVVARIMPEAIKAVAAVRVPTAEDFRQLFEAEQAKWALDFERRAQDLFQKAIDRIPVPQNGKDGFSIDDVQIEHDGDGLVKFTWVRDHAIVKEATLRLPRFKDQGVYKQESQYIQGDGVTWGGSFFIAQKDAPVGKPGESADWRCAVKRGQDGKDFRPGDSKPLPPVRIK